MDIEIALQLLELATSLVKSESGIDIDETVADILTAIARKAVQTYHDHMGEPMDGYLLTA